jgi:hypothetical protein
LTIRVTPKMIDSPTATRNRDEAVQELDQQEVHGEAIRVRLSGGLACEGRAGSRLRPF